MGNNIILVGFMGTGKTTIGKRLSAMLNRRFLDADKEIEKLTGMTLMTLYHKYGKVRFQSEEDLMLKKLLKEDNCVIATGGSLILDEQKYRLLSESGLVICLTADPKIIEQRVQRRNNRPLLSRNNMYHDILELSKEREGMHNRADLCVDTSHRNFEEIIAVITEFLQKQYEEQKIEGV